MVRGLCASVALFAIAMPAQAAVSIQFYSREMGNYFPHAFVVMSGHPDSDPRPVDASYGFTAVSVSPSILMGAVKGTVEPVPASYLAGSTRHFTVQVTDDQYARIRALIHQYETLPQPSYDLHKRNCVHFAAAVAREVGLHADDYAKLMTKPNAYMTKVRLDNPVLGDGVTTVTSCKIAQANGTPLPGQAPTEVARAATPAQAAASTAASASANRYAPQPQLSAAAIAAGYGSPKPSNDR